MDRTAPGDQAFPPPQSAPSDPARPTAPPPRIAGPQRSSVSTARDTDGLSPRQARRYRRATDVGVPWWMRARSLALLAVLIIALGLATAALVAGLVAVATMLLEQLMS